MDKLRAKGLCDWIGLTGLGDPPALHQVIDSGRFDVVQIYYNLLNPTAMAGAGQGGTRPTSMVSCTGASPRTWGSWAFASSPPGTWPAPSATGAEAPITANAENAAEEARAKAALAVLGTQHGTPAQAALRFGLACPLLSTIVVGIGETWHLDQALGAAEMGPLPASALQDLENLRRTHPAFRS